jgi:hypothetical protein
VAIAIGERRVAPGEARRDRQTRRDGLEVPIDEFICFGDGSARL